ncbi:MAG: FtsX-like permease family protein [Candidatus Aegiribacteria sp.]|nr:FtsX-like permease family protein [Candidatus Aegiribacteria sp.]MBD3294769.1 FtsX-like permease family protein [Candidatus Fermentibacteria bacterium]
MIHLIRNAVREGMLNIRSKLATFLITLLMVSLSFMVFDIFLVVSWNLGTVLKSEQENVGIEVFLDETVDEIEARNLADLISGMEGVRSVYYVSPREAEAIFRADLPEQADLLTLLGPQFHLPASVQVTLHPQYRTSESVSALARTIGGMDGVEDTVYGKEYLPGLTRAVDILEKLVILAGLVLAVSLSLVVANTVRLAVAKRKLSVQIMSIVGAPGWFVRLPFIGEGLLTGMAGSAGSLLMTGAVSWMLTPSVPHLFLPGKWILLVLLLGASAGAAGSWIGMRSGIPKPRS